MKLFILIIFIFLLASYSKADDRSQVEKAVEQVNSLRESSVKGVAGAVDSKIFKTVCGPVGLKVKGVKKEKGFLIRQASDKYRNPKNKASKYERNAIERFKKEPKLTHFWVNRGGANHYFHKIVVKKDCLACHGSKISRPDFIKIKYPSDSAFGFDVGDIRGVYHVRIK